MRLRRRAALDGRELDLADERILIQGIESQAGKDTITAVSAGGYDGMRAAVIRRDSLDILIRFSINEKSYRPAERAEVFERVMEWAQPGGWLTVNYKPGRKIRVIPAQYPGEGDIADRGNQYSITLRAYGNPFWQEETPQEVTYTSVSSGSKSIRVGGITRTPLEFSFKNTSGSAVNELKLYPGSDNRKGYIFNSLALANNETLIVDHEDTGIRCLQRIRILNAAGTAYRSAAAKRYGFDEVWAQPGDNSYTLEAGGAGTLTLRATGRFG